VYFFAAPEAIFLLASYVCSNNLTRSIGATIVFDMTAEVPPTMKSFANSVGVTDFFLDFECATAPSAIFFLV